VLDMRLMNAMGDLFQIDRAVGAVVRA
jgi:hypothetical protein